MLADLIARSQAGKSNATIMIIRKFNPLLKKYAYKLYYEDAYYDLLTDFIELIHNVQLESMHDKSDGSFISYIHKSIYDSYIKRSVNLKKLNNIVLYSDLSDNQLFYIETVSATSDIYFEHELPVLQKVMTKSELEVINMLYLRGYTVTETACDLGVTRQAVNQMKKRALKKLQILYVDKL